METGDKIQLQQVILNLVINAIEAMHEVSEASRELCVSSEKVTDTSDEIEQEASSLPKARVLVVVGDSGPGLDSTQLQRVFETYYTTKSQGNGHGTGDQPFDYRSSRRPALGEKEYASWCAV